MLRRHHRFFQSLQLIRDALGVGGAFYLAYTLRFSMPHLLPYTAPASPEETGIIVLMLIAVWAAVAWMGGLYTSHRMTKGMGEVWEGTKTTALALGVLVTLTYFIRDVRYSRAVLLLWAPLNAVALAILRGLSRVLLRYLRAKGYHVRHVLVVGDGQQAERVVEILSTTTSLGLRVQGVVVLNEASPRTHPKTYPGTHPSVGGAPVLGTAADLGHLVHDHAIDQVLIALPITQWGALESLMRILSRETVDVRLIPDFFQYITLCGGVEEFHGLPIINLQATPLGGWNLVFKRTFDLVASGLGLVLLAPLMGGIAFGLWLVSPGSVLFRQQRVGMDGRCFTMLKFRTMRLDAEQAGARMTSAEDPRRTLWGSSLRRWSLDELPQLWNVLKGEMSLVGPRPEQPCFTESFKQAIPRYALRHKIKAGMTGWAQIHGMRGNTSMSKRIEMDLYYIENWSLLLDIKIVLRTVLGGFMSPHAY